MRSHFRVAAAAAALLPSLLITLLDHVPVHAAAVTTTNACFSNATATYSDLAWTLSGTATPNPAAQGSTATLSSSNVSVDVPATLLIAGYNLGLLTVGANNIPVKVWVARQATNVTGTAVQVDSFTATVVTTITDPNGTPGTGDETATPLHVDQPLPNMVVTPATEGSNVEFSQAPAGALGSLPIGVGGAVQAVQGSLFAQASVANGLIKANFDCQPGTTIINPPGGTSGTTFTPATAAPFETLTVAAPAAQEAPVCADESLSVVAGQTINVNLTDNCTDANGGPLTYQVVTPPADGTLTETSPGLYSYVGPGAGMFSLMFTATDGTQMVSAPATVTLTVTEPPPTTTTTTTPATTSTTTTTTIPPATAPPTESTIPATPVSGSFSYTASCTNSVTPDLAELSFDASGTALSPVVTGVPFTVTNQAWTVTVPASVFQTGINLGLLQGGQQIAGVLAVTIAATGTTQATQSFADIAVSVPVTVDGSNVAQPATVPFTVPEATWMAASPGTVAFRYATSTVLVTIGPLKVTFTCTAKTADPYLSISATGATIPTTLPQPAPVSPSSNLPRAGSSQSSVLIQVGIGLLLLDLGYLLLSALRRPRRQSG